jgi:hypothetical protein
MLNFKFQIIALLLMSFANISCSYSWGSQESICLIPEGYIGPVVIVFDDENGIVPHLEKNKNVYEIPTSGILRVKAKANYQIEENVYYYVDKKGNRTNLNYLYPGGGAWKDKENNFDNVDYSKDKIFCMNDSMGRTIKNGKDISYRVFLVGKAKDVNSLEMRIEDVLSKVN